MFTGLLACAAADDDPLLTGSLPNSIRRAQQHLPAVPAAVRSAVLNS